MERSLMLCSPPVSTGETILELRIASTSIMGWLTTALVWRVLTCRITFQQGQMRLTSCKGVNPAILRDRISRALPDESS